MQIFSQIKTSNNMVIFFLAPGQGASLGWGGLDAHGEREHDPVQQPSWQDWSRHYGGWVQQGNAEGYPGDQEANSDLAGHFERNLLWLGWRTLPSWVQNEEVCGSEYDHPLYLRYCLLGSLRDQLFLTLGICQWGVSFAARRSPERKVLLSVRNWVK